jgi:hypothetical protein
LGAVTKAQTKTAANTTSAPPAPHIIAWRVP